MSLASRHTAWDDSLYILACAYDNCLVKLVLLTPKWVGIMVEATTGDAASRGVCA